METQDLAGLDTSAPTAPEVVNHTEPNVPATVTATDGETDQTKEQAAERTFTQAELNDAIQKRLLKEERRMRRRLEDELRTHTQQAQATVQPKRESFADDEAYHEAHLEHLAAKKAEQLLAERERQSVEQKRRESFLEKAEAAQERYADFDAVVHNERLPINASMAEFIAESDMGADIAYYLGKNISVSARIAGMSPVMAARELVKIENDLASKPKAQASKAPEPITPVGNRGKSGSTSSPTDDDDISTWMRKERERQSKRFAR